MTLQGNKINLPISVVIPFGDKFRIRLLVSRQPLPLHVILKQGRTLFCLEHNARGEENVSHFNSENRLGNHGK